MRLEWLKIERFPGVEPETELEFSDGFNLLVGKNGTGKTTLLKLIIRILRSDFSGLEPEPFNLSYRIRSDKLVLEVACRAEPKVDENDPITWLHPTVNWWYKIVLTEGGKKFEFINNSQESENGISLFRPIFLLSAFSNSGFGLHMLPGLVRAWLDFRRFDEGLDIYRSITAKKERMFGVVLRRGEPGHESSVYYFVPTDLTTLIKQKGKKNEPFIDVSEVEFLARLLSSLGYDEGRLVARSDGTKQVNGQLETQYDQFNFTFSLNNGPVIPDSRLSFGEKRLLAFHYYAACNPHTIVADELVNGLHHTWIEDCLDLISDRQCFLTSQNPLLLDYLPFDDAEQVRKTFVLCEQPEGRAGPWRWRNMSRADAESFMSAYNVGIQHVSEILKDKGLW